jgi:chromosome segregation ATPase
MSGMAGDTTHDRRLTTLEAEAFRTGRTLAEHGEQLQRIGEQQKTAFGNIDSLADAIGSPGDRTIAQRLNTMEQGITAVLEDLGNVRQRLDGMERILFALARSQGIDPDQT